jgi:tRNA (cmo5U34)-methyltransferase
MSEEIIIREIAEQDYSLLPEFLFLAIAEELGPEVTVQYVCTEPKHSVYFDGFGRREDFGVVAEHDGRVIGAAWSRLIVAYGYVNEVTPELVIAVLPEFHGKGIGGRLLERLFEVLTWNSFYRVSLAVIKENPALRLYERLGFKTVRETEDDYIMVKEISPEKMDDFFAKRIDFYDEHMLSGTDLGVFYQNIPTWISFSGSSPRVLDLGIGTGLELEGLYKKYPDMQVTGVDLSQKMLDKLREKYPDKPLDLICASYFDVDFGAGSAQGSAQGFDLALSIYSLHHFSEDLKLGLYRRICEALKPEGEFVLGDFTVATEEMQDMLLAENNRVRAEHGLAADELLHIDLPFTVETEVRLMKEAGFSTVQVLHQEKYASVIKACR